MSGRFLVDARAPKPPLDFRALAAALSANQAATPTAQVVAPAQEDEQASRALARQVAGSADETR